MGRSRRNRARRERAAAAQTGAAEISSAEGGAGSAEASSLLSHQDSITSTARTASAAAASFDRAGDLRGLEEGSASSSPAATDHIVVDMGDGREELAEVTFIARVRERMAESYTAFRAQPGSAQVEQVFHALLGATASAVTPALTAGARTLEPTPIHLETMYPDVRRRSAEGAPGPTRPTGLEFPSTMSLAGPAMFTAAMVHSVAASIGITYLSDKAVKILAQNVLGVQYAEDREASVVTRAVYGPAFGAQISAFPKLLMRMAGLAPAAAMAFFTYSQMVLQGGFQLVNAEFNPITHTMDFQTVGEPYRGPRSNTLEILDVMNALMASLGVAITLHRTGALKPVARLVTRCVVGTYETLRTCVSALSRAMPGAHIAEARPIRQSSSASTLPMLDASQHPAHLHTGSSGYATFEEPRRPSNPDHSSAGARS